LINSISKDKENPENSENDSRKKSRILNNEDHVQNSLDKLGARKRNNYHNRRISNNTDNQNLNRKLSVMDASNTRKIIANAVGQTNERYFLPFINNIIFYSNKYRRKSLGGISISKLDSSKATVALKKHTKHWRKHSNVPSSNADHHFENRYESKGCESSTKSQTNNEMILNQACY
jgi:hypothetical protein